MRIRIRAFARSIVLVAVAFTGGCGGGDPVGPVDPEDLVFAPSLGVDLGQMTRTASGLYYEVLEAGEGEEVAEAGDAAAVYYTGWLHTGVEFDSLTSGSPFTVSPLGTAGVIQGWNEGLQGMRINETRLLVIPSELAYGDRRAGIIPRYATLVFEVTLVELTKAGG